MIGGSLEEAYNSDTVVVKASAHAHGCDSHRRAMIGENGQLVTNGPVEFKKQPVEVEDCRKIMDRFRGIYRIQDPNLIKENLRMPTCNQLDLQTLGSQPVMMPKYLSP